MAFGKQQAVKGQGLLDRSIHDNYLLVGLPGRGLVGLVISLVAT